MHEGRKGTKRAQKTGDGRPLSGRSYYYLSNEGADKRVILSSQADFDRFEAYLYLLNAIESPRAANLFVGGREKEIFSVARGENLVAIGAYALLPQSFHLLVTPLVDGGVGKFMQKIQTAYTMYFNAKYGHSGRVFHSAYRSQEMRAEEELKRLFVRVHLAPAELFDTEWQNTEGSNLATHISRAMEYRYSSINEYRNGSHIITSPDEFPLWMRRAKKAEAYYGMWLKDKSD